jgi:hypothetical protein
MREGFSMSVTEIDPYKLSSPHIFLFRMFVFVALAAFLALILYETIWKAFITNPGLNGLIFAVLFIGILLAFRQVVRLLPEVRWVNSFRVNDPGLGLRYTPVLLAPMASMLGHRLGRAVISTFTLRSILDSVGTRLDEARDIGRYLTGLLVFLGLLGTFWGLLETVSSIGGVIQSLGVGPDSSAMFDDLKRGLAQPLQGMGLAFSSSLFGLAGSLVLGFLDLQASQAQNRFYNELEDWLSATVTDSRVDQNAGSGNNGAGDGMSGVLIDVLGRLNDSLADGTSSRNAAQSMTFLAEGVQSLVQHMRKEQNQVRGWLEEQAAGQRELRDVLEKLAAQTRTGEFSGPVVIVDVEPSPSDRSGA